ncbi:MAG: copper amine oxidase N-terminal domain-containing protein [Syntrophomonas sp.]
MPRLSKKFALLLVLAMLASMFVGMGTASAASDNTAITIPSIAATTNSTALGTIRIQESSSSVNTFAAYQQITITLPSGVEFNAVPTAAANIVDTGYGAITVNAGATTKTFTITLGARNGAIPTTTKTYFDITFGDVKTDGADGDIAVDIFAPNTPVTSGSVVVARATAAGTTSTVLDTKTVANGSGKLIGTIRIAENRGGAVKLAGSQVAYPPNGRGQIKIVAPADVTIAGIGVPTFVNWTQNGATNIAPNSDGYSQADFYVNTTAGGATPGFVTIDLTVNIDDDTVTGPLSFTIKGDGVTTQTVSVGTVGDYSVTAAAIGDPKTVYVGAAKQAINDFTLKENLQGSLLARDLKFTLPSFAHWYTDPSITVDKGTVVLTKVQGAGATYDTNRNVITFTVATGTKSAFTFKDDKIFLDANAPEGDVTMQITGAGLSEAINVVVGKVVAPVAVTSAAKDVKIGVSGQVAGDIVITEAVASALKKKVTTVDNDWAKPALALTDKDPAQLIIKLPSGVTFTQKPTVAVTTGDLRFVTNNINLAVGDSQLVIPIDKASTTASTITISDIKYTVDRTVPEGDVKVVLAGSALDMQEDATAGEFFTQIVSVSNAKTVTPAPGEIVNLATFVIGSTKLTINGAETTMDVAPYIKDGRTFLPLAYVAQALGVTPANILWDGANQTVTLMKGDKVVQVKIGSTTMVINGAPITMDVAPEISNNRTCLPVALLAQAFGSSATWDAATQTVTIQ